MKQEMAFEQVHQICSKHEIDIQDLASVTGSFDKQIFFINQEILLRVSETPMTIEQEKSERVAGLDFVPKILHAGALESAEKTIYYILSTLLPGDDLINSYQATTPVQQNQLGRDVAKFLDRLHQIPGTHYDVGLYIPIIPHFSETWKAGHQTYWDILEQQSHELSLQPEQIRFFANAFQFLHASAEALNFQAGPKLLHNDFHPKNILCNQGQFSGVIDWECSQFGEADFELCHLIHWCVYPPQSGIDFRPFLRGLFQSAPKCAQVPNLAQRLTIYQVEHEIQQIIWSSSQAASWRVPRLLYWMDGGVEKLFREI